MFKIIICTPCLGNGRSLLHGFKMGQNGSGKNYSWNGERTEWCGHPGRTELRGGNMGENSISETTKNIFFFRSTNFKLLNHAKGIQKSTVIFLKFYNL